MYRPVLLPILLIAGCYLTTDEVDQRRRDLGFGDADTDTDADSDVDVEVSITAVLPAYGTQAGATEVVITTSEKIVGGIDDLSVRFGEVDATVVEVQDRVVIVNSPPSPRDGPVDVQLVTPSGSDRATDAFVYWKAGAGHIASFGAIHWDTFQGGYWADGTAQGSGWFMFTVPLDATYRDVWGTQLDSCASGHSFDLDQLKRYPAGGPVQMRSGSVTLDFFYEQNTSLYVTALEADDFKSTAGYDLLPIENPAPYWPEAMLVEDFVRTGSPIRILSPDVDGADAGDLFTQSLALQWDNPNSGDYVIASINRWVWDGSTYQNMEEVRCLLRDDGSHTVPAGVWNDWEQFGTQYLGIALGRVAETGAVLPHNEGRSGMVGIYWTNGAVFTN